MKSPSTSRAGTALSALVGLVMACGNEDTPPAPPDAAVDVTADPSDAPDAGTDAAPQIDTGNDPGEDVAPPSAPNTCGGSELLAGVPGQPCGPCADGRWRCEPGGETVTCAGATSRNACGGCGELAGAPGDSCGPCGGVWACDFGEGALLCEGSVARNACGGCEELGAQPGFGCTAGLYTCDGPNRLACRQTTANPCGGDAGLVLDPPLGAECGACGQGVTVCDGDGATACVDSELGVNACGSCGALDGEPGAPCGCGGTWTCGADGEAVCDGDLARNACGGCLALEDAPGDACEGGQLACDGAEALRCAPAGGNACGGSLPLGGEPGDTCGACEDGVLQCVSRDAIACVGATEPNACGGCGVLPGTPDDACGTGRRWACRAGALVCDPAPVRNACGGSAVLDATPGTSCGQCEAGVVVCVDANTVECVGGGRSARNACGGCGPLTVDGLPFDDVPGGRCGVCDSGTWACVGVDDIACVGEVAETLRTYHADRDGDGYGSRTETRTACSTPLGFVENAADCNDLDDRTRPGGTETCDGQDNDCDEAIDEDFIAYVDADRDGFGAPGEGVIACLIEPGLSRNAADCDDTNGRVFPGQAESYPTPRADGSFDYDCDGEETQLWTRRPYCEGPPLCGTVFTDEGTYEGWATAGVLPDCGVSGAWLVTCTLTLDGCTAVIDPEPRVQRCR